MCPFAPGFWVLVGHSVPDPWVLDTGWQLGGDQFLVLFLVTSGSDFLEGGMGLQKGLGNAVYQVAPKPRGMGHV